uniref:Uncharacterized protein n=1 Tax=Neogobius melanostomus TaxID=47308 RepID=A0A8C6SE81_9GOBI
MDTAKNKKRPASSSAETPAQTPTKIKKRRVYSSATKKLESDRHRQKTRVNIGEAFEKWKILREYLGLTKDPQLASFLLERPIDGPLTSTPYGPIPPVQ